MSTSLHTPDATPDPAPRAGTDLQLYPPLDAATESALRASIEKHGVLVPVAVDQNDRVIDGHHRSRIATELDIPFDSITVWVSGDEHAREIARTLNEDRRQLPIDQRREVVADLRDQGHSTRAIAGAVGVSHTQVRRDISGGTSVPPDAKPANPKGLDAVGATEPALPIGNAAERVTGTDGKSYPAKRQMPELDPVEKARRARESEQIQAHLNLTSALIPLNSHPIEPERYAQGFADSLAERLAEFKPEVLEKAAAVLLAMAAIRRSM